MQKPRFFEGVVADGYVVLNRDDTRYRKLEHLAKAADITNIYGYGENLRAQFKLAKYKPMADGSVITARINGVEVATKIGAPGASHCAKCAGRDGLRPGLRAQISRRCQWRWLLWKLKKGEASSTS